MQQNTLDPIFLFLYGEISGSWDPTKLVNPVSPHTVEAMNLILEQDGIAAFIGTRSEFGSFLSKLGKKTGKVGHRSLTSLPRNTILSMLGLCLNAETDAKPELVWHGSPLSIGLSYLVMLHNHDLDSIIENIYDKYMYNNHSGSAVFSVPKAEYNELAGWPHDYPVYEIDFDKIATIVQGLIDPEPKPEITSRESVVTIS
jgi:hypothetical protein